MNAKKTFGIVLLSVSAFLFLALTSLFGNVLFKSLLGVFGVLGYLLFLFLSLLGVAFISGAKYQFSWKYILYCSILAFCFCAIIHMSFTFDVLESSYGVYLKSVYARVSPCGALFSLIVWPIQYLVFPVGAYVLFILIMVIMIALIIDYLHANKNFRKLAMISSTKTYTEESTKTNPKIENLGISIGGFYDPILKEGITHQPKAIESNINEGVYKPKIKMDSASISESVMSAREEALIKLGFGNTKNENVENKISNEELANKINRFNTDNIVLTPKIANSIPDFETAKKTALEMMSLKNQAMADNVEANFIGDVGVLNNNKDNENVNSLKVETDVDIIKNTFFNSNFSVANQVPDEPKGIENEEKNSAENSNDCVDNDFESAITEHEEVLTDSELIIDENINKLIKEIQEENPELVSNFSDSENIEIESDFDKLIENEIEKNNDSVIDFQKEPVYESELVKNFKQNYSVNNFKEKPNQQSFFEEEKEKNNKPTFTIPSNYVKPSLDILKVYEQHEDLDDEELKLKADILEETLNNFKVPVNVVAITKGPAVTRFELQVQQGITVKKILQFSNDIAMALEAKGGIRIEAPIPGKNAVGVEVPNSKIQTIGLKDILSTQEFKKSNPLSVGLGRDIAGSTILCDIKQMPHLMVAGATGSGKSVCLSVILVSLLYKMGPDDLKLILIDPKRVEFSAFNGLPHMLLPEAITEPKDAINALNWAMNEMDRRFSLFHELRVNKIDDYNNREDVRAGKDPKLPTIVIVIDELADLIMTAKRDVEEKIRRLSQLARAAGIHLIVATQRPSVDVITGTIKANLPSRIAFMVSSGPDSKTILDQYGAENLLGKGDMLYSPSNYTEPKRVQCAFISGDEVRSVVENIKNNNVAFFDENVQNEIFKKDQDIVVNKDELDDSKAEFDSILPDALKLAIETRQASVSMIQRRFAVGYARAARILDQMERMKFVSPTDGSKARSVYITIEEYNAIFGDKN